ncbi:MAG: hypothetical protein HYW52_00260, partial [Gemmatimonadetes bacterium]|nr:hypothetical protein [Gemmatimonadota bacterium]
MKRRDVVQLLALAPLAGIEWTAIDAERAARAVAGLRARGQAYQPKFFTAHEYQQVKHMQETFRALIAETGGTPLSPMPPAERGYGISN